jgi:hypothetical protein
MVLALQTIGRVAVEEISVFGSGAVGEVGVLVVTRMGFALDVESWVTVYRRARSTSSATPFRFAGMVVQRRVTCERLSRTAPSARRQSA